MRIGVLGLGMAGGVMVPVIAAHPRTTLAAAADLDPQLRKRFARNYPVPVFDSAEELASREEVDAIYVATPHQFHCAHTLLAVRHGKHVIVEKPMALTLTDCDAMIETARKAHVALIVGHTHGFDPTIEAMRRLIESGDAGAPRLVTSINYTNFIYRPRRPEELDLARGGGVVWNQLPHQLDMIRVLVQKPVRSVRAMMASLDPSRGVEALCAAFISFENGAAASLSYSGYDRFDTDAWHDWIGESGNLKSAAHGRTRAALQEIAGKETRVRAERYGYGGDAFESFKSVAPPHFGVLIVSCEHADLVQTGDGFDVFDASGRSSVTVPVTSQRPGHVAVLDELIAAASGSQVLRDGLFGRATVEVVLALIRSAQEGREVTIAEIRRSSNQPRRKATS